MGKATIVLIVAGLLLGVGLLVAFPGELIQSFWSVPDRMWRSVLGSLFVGGIILAIGYQLVLHWLLRDWWYLVFWTLMSVFIAAALTVATLAAIVQSSALADQVRLPMVLGAPTLVALLVLALNFGPARQMARNRWLARIVPNLPWLRGGELWRRIDNRRRANVNACANLLP